MGKQPNDFGFVEETQAVLAPQEEPRKENFGFVEESRAVLKKKESTVTEVSSPKPSPEVGSEESPKPSEQDGKPTEKATGSLQPPVLEYLVDPLLALAKQIYSGLADQTPKNIAQGIEVLKSGLQSGNVEDFIRQKKAIEFQKYVRGKEKQRYLDTPGLEEKDVLKWYQGFDIEKYLPQYKEAFIKDKGYQEMKKKIEANLPEVIKRRLETEEYVQEQNKEAAETLKGVPQSYRDIKTPKQAVEYAFNMGAQGLWQIPLTVISKGMSGEIMEAATVYDQQLDQLAEKHKISREEVIKRNLDKPAAGQLYAVAAAGLDLASAGGVVNIAKKGGTPLLQKTLAATTEVITEPTQGTLEEMGGAKGAGKSQVKAFEKAWSTNLSKRIDEGLGAVFGTQAINAVGAIKSVPETIVDAKETIKSSGDINAADQAAATIIEKVKSALEEGVTNDSSIGQREVQSEEFHGEEPIKATEQGNGSEKIGTSGMVSQSPPSSQTQEVNETPVTSQGGGVEEPGATQVSETPPQETLPPQEQLQSTVTEQTGQTSVAPLPEATAGAEPTVSTNAEETKGRKEGETLLTSEGSKGEGLPNQPSPASGQGAPQTNEATTTTGSNALPNQQEVATEGTPPKTPPEPKAEPTTPGKERQFAVARRIEASDANPAIKRGIKEQGDTYIPKGLALTENEAQDIIEHHGTEKSEAMLKDPSNDITPDTRVVIAGKLYEQYAAEGKNEKAVDTAIWAENFLMQAGRAANAGKFWKMITASGEDQIVLAIERQQQQQAGKVLQGIDVLKTRDQIEAEIRRLVESKVQATVGERLESAKLITKEKRKEIGAFFDSLKINTKNNIATASLLPIGVLPHVWNAAVDVIKQAVLTGADVANAIQAGIDYIKANQKEPFDEKRFREEFTSQIQAIMPRGKVKASEIDENAVDTPRLSGKRKTDFINKVVDAYNEGKLTDKKFDELYASKLGLKELSQEDRGKIRELAKAVAEAEKFEDELMNLPIDQFTRENINNLKGLREAAIEANEKLNEFSRGPSNVWDTLSTILKGNIMSPISLVSNIFYNVIFQPVRFAYSGGVSMVSYGFSKMARLVGIKTALDNKNIDFIAIQKGYFKGLWNGLNEGLHQLKTGVRSDEKNLREIQTSFNPVKAIKRWKDSDRTASQKINDVIEGTLGIPANIIFHLLNLGDKPFKRAAELATAMRIGTEKGLKGKELEKFVLLPDAETQEQITKEGQEATFQQTTPITKGVQKVVTGITKGVGSLPLIGGPLKLLIASQIPFVKTPTNIITFTIQLALPLPTILSGIYQIANGNNRSGGRLMAIGITGLALQQVAFQLFAKGIMTGDDDKDKKKRDYEKEGPIPQPNSINTSALARGLAGDGFETKDGDDWVSYSKMGPIGICFDNYANMYKSRIEEGVNENYLVEQGTMTIRTLSSAFEQSFLYATSNLLEAIKSGDEKTMRTWAIKTTESLGAIIYPNTIATFGKASDEYLRDTKDENFMQELANVYKAKMFAGGSLPARVSLWGDKITGNPEGRNKYAYYLFDPSKFKSVDVDDYRYKLYQYFKKDYDGDWLPSMPKRSLSVHGEQIKLTPKEYEELCIKVGKERAASVQAYMNSDQIAGQDDERRKKRLKELYEQGYDRGKNRFVMDHGLNVRVRDIKAQKKKQ